MANDAQLEWMQRVLGVAFSSSVANPAPSVVRYAKTRLAWLTARKKVEADLEKLRLAINDSFKEDGIAGELDRLYRERTRVVMAELDERLADRLDAAYSAQDQAARAQHVAGALETITRYEAFLENDPMVAHLDENPFVPMSIQHSLSSALKTISAAIR